MPEPETIIRGSDVKAEDLGRITGSRPAPECPVLDYCAYALPGALCTLPVCRDRYHDPAVRLARWAVGRMIKEWGDLTGHKSETDVCRRFGLTQFQYLASRAAFAQDGTHWITASTLADPTKPIDWRGGRILGRCGLCGGTIVTDQDGAKCSMCARQKPVMAAPPKRITTAIESESRRRELAGLGGRVYAGLPARPAAAL